jgi:hypothetical protein
MINYKLIFEDMIQIGMFVSASTSKKLENGEYISKEYKTDVYNYAVISLTNLLNHKDLFPSIHLIDVKYIPTFDIIKKIINSFIEKMEFDGESLTTALEFCRIKYYNKLKNIEEFKTMDDFYDFKLNVIGKSNFRKELENFEILMTLYDEIKICKNVKDLKNIIKNKINNDCEQEFLKQINEYVLLSFTKNLKNSLEILKNLKKIYTTRIHKKIIDSILKLYK